MRILIAPDKFKGSLSALEAANAIQRGFSKVFPRAQFDLTPIADGGEGTGAIFLSALNGETIEADSHDALGRPIRGKYAWFPDEKLAVIEMSETSGLWRLTAAELNPSVASTFGTGELMADAIARGAETLFIALGGSATNDAGVGMAAALGWTFLDEAENEIEPLPGNFPAIRFIQKPAAPLPVQVVALCDVNNPLLGEFGATRVYGPQKGVRGDMIEPLEAALRHVADLCGETLGWDYRNTPGAGATGGLAFGLMTFCQARVEQGFDAVADLLGLQAKIAQANLIITGEGRIDHQSLHGKGPAEVARLARAHGRPVIAFAGKVEGELPIFDACLPITNGPLTLDECRADAAQLLEDTAQRAAQLLKISL